MAKVSVKVSGGALKELEVDTIKEARIELGLDKTYTATVNGEPEDDGYETNDFEYIVFAPAVKGGVR